MESIYCSNKWFQSSRERRHRARREYVRDDTVCGAADCSGQVCATYGCFGLALLHPHARTTPLTFVAARADGSAARPACIPLLLPRGWEEQLRRTAPIDVVSPCHEGGRDSGSARLVLVSWREKKRGTRTLCGRTAKLGIPPHGNQQISQSFSFFKPSISRPASLCI